jgi:hypothetical protein
MVTTSDCTYRCCDCTDGVTVQMVWLYRWWRPVTVQMVTTNSRCDCTDGDDQWLYRCCDCTDGVTVQMVWLYRWWRPVTVQMVTTNSRWRLDAWQALLGKKGETGVRECTCVEWNGQLVLYSEHTWWNVEASRLLHNGTAISTCNHVISAAAVRWDWKVKATLESFLSVSLLMGVNLCQCFPCVHFSREYLCAEE